ncbi:hypothetical protein [Halorussus sp. AFM4]|uniref:hypothetical protein n=1 Tax=Halorussus sp. AFM4 TaxID=3421651 RepID=UPI003EBB0576
MTGSNPDKSKNSTETLVEDRLKAFDRRLDAHSKRFDYLKDKLKDERDRHRELATELKATKKHLQELEDEIGQLDSRTDILTLVQNSDEMDGEQRSTAIIQHLHRAAQKQHDRGGPAKSSVNRDEAEAALQYPDVDRTTIYRDMERAVRLVGDERVLWYDGASGGESRLKLSLESEDLPKKFTARESL